MLSLNITICINHSESSLSDILVILCKHNKCEIINRGLNSMKTCGNKALNLGLLYTVLIKRLLDGKESHFCGNYWNVLARITWGDTSNIVTETKSLIWGYIPILRCKNGQFSISENWEISYEICDNYGDERFHHFYMVEIFACGQDSRKIIRPRIICRFDNPNMMMNCLCTNSDDIVSTK